MRSPLFILRGLNIVVYDCEIKATIDGKKVGWDDKDKMGISVACLYDYRDGDTKVYLDDNLPALVERLNTADLVVAFNQKQFDNPLVRATVPGLKPDAPRNALGELAVSAIDYLYCYDMLEESRIAVNFTGNPHTGGLKLDDHLLYNFGAGLLKTAHGSEAPKMYQEGRYGELISYCLGDIRRERMLFELAWCNREYFCGVHGKRVVRDPRELMRPGSKREITLTDAPIVKPKPFGEMK